MASKQRYVLNGKEVTEAEFVALPSKLADLLAGNAPGAKNTALWPIVSDAFGVHPSQIAEAVKADRERGVRVEYTKNGSAIFTSQQHQREVLRAHGMHNKADYLG